MNDSPYNWMKFKCQISLPIQNQVGITHHEKKQSHKGSSEMIPMRKPQR